MIYLLSKNMNLHFKVAQVKKKNQASLIKIKVQISSTTKLHKFIKVRLKRKYEQLFNFMLLAVSVFFWELHSAVFISIVRCSLDNILSLSIRCL